MNVWADGRAIVKLTRYPKSQLITAILSAIIQFLAHLPRPEVAALLLIAIVSVFIMAPGRNECGETGQCQTDETECS